eukprot:10650966-Lingulodinium_polyedra.AAC.1
MIERIRNNVMQLVPIRRLPHAILRRGTYARPYCRTLPRSFHTPSQNNKCATRPARKTSS